MLSLLFVTKGEGWSQGRTIVTGATALALAGLVLGGIWMAVNRAKGEWLSAFVNRWYGSQQRVQAGWVLCFAIALTGFEFTLFSFMFLPRYLAGPAIWVTLTPFQTAFVLSRTAPEAIRLDSWNLFTPRHLEPDARRNFYLAALFCGLASVTRLVGFFFVLTVGVYLLVGRLRGRPYPLGRVLSQ